MEIVFDGKICMITDEHIEKIANVLYQKITDARNAASEVGETCNKNTAAKLLGVSRCTVYNMIRDGRIEATSDGRRVVTESIDRYKNKMVNDPDNYKRQRRVRKAYV